MTLIVHPGFPKTATTYLQTQVFPRLRTVAFEMDTDERFILPSCDVERPDGDALISCEAIFNFHPERYHAIPKLIDLSPDVVLITIRRQDTTVRSLRLNRNPVPSEDYFHYHEPIEWVQAQTSARIEVLLYEELIANPAVYAARLSLLFGEPLALPCVRVNPAPERAIWMPPFTRRLPRWMKDKLRPLASHDVRLRPLTDGQLRSNRRLAALFPHVPFDRYGYLGPGAPTMAK